MKNDVLVRVLLIACTTVLSSPVLAQTPEEQKVWEIQRAQRQADEKAKVDLLLSQRAARKADPMAWVRTLNPMTEGGWQFRTVAPDGSWAAFSTEHQLKRSGHMVTAWLRQEYPEVQHTENGDVYFSNVEKIQYDCAKSRGRPLAVIYYSENNIAGAQRSDDMDPKSSPWGDIVPGTQGDTLYQWACATLDAKKH